MKKFKSFFLLYLIFSMAAGTYVFAGGGKETAPTKPKPAAAGKVLTHDELVAAAKAEGTVVVYSVTSRIAKAAKTFTAKYGIKVEATNLKDFELIEKISKEGQTGAKGADFVLCQDGGRVMGELINQEYLYNYVPPTMKKIIPVKFQNPLAFAFINKVFIYNDEATKGAPFHNIWALTTPKWKGNFQFKNPFQEGVNANFLTMVTEPAIADKIAAAYKDYFGKPITLTTPNAGYEWIKRLFENDLIITTSDTKTAESIGVKGQNKPYNAGLFVYAKFRYKKSKNLALEPIMDVDPFSGFYYPIYALMDTNAVHPNAAKLFIEYLLTAEGFKPWSANLGTYSSNPNIPLVKGDHPMTTWTKILIKEDPTYCFENRGKVEEFLNNYIY